MEDSNTMSPPPKTKINFEEDGKDEDNSNVVCTVKPVPEKFICFVCKEILLRTLDGLIRHILINHTEVLVDDLVQFPESQQDDSIAKSQTLPVTTGSDKGDSYYLSILLISSENIAIENDSIRGARGAAFHPDCSTSNSQMEEQQHSISNDPGTSKTTAKQLTPTNNNEEENVGEGNKAEDDLGEGDLDKDGDEPYPCPMFCGSVFYSKELLSLHVLNHHGHRNTITELVIKNTSQTPTTPTTLQAHSFSIVIMSSTSQTDPVEPEEGDYNGEVNDDVEPYICYGCLMPFYSTDRLLEHIRRFHVGQDFKFLKFLLQRTFEEYRSNNFKTDRQPPTTRTTSELEPIAMYANEVEVLSGALESDSTTSIAVQEEPPESAPAEHEKEGSCAPSEVSDSSSVSSVKPFSCKICNKAVRRLDNLRRHLKNVHEMPVKVVNKYASEAHAEYNKNKLASTQMKLQKISPNSSSAVMSNSTNSQPSTSSSTRVNRSDTVVKSSTRKSRGTKRKPLIISEPRSLGSRKSARLFEKQQRARSISSKGEVDGETRTAIGSESFPACGESSESSRGPIGTTDGK
ncbi:unnamed protein product [Orchesella dallaii]|uniref:C2H2-type domain-containing protein n=1 Tax=Orchesella dallaii TaxID=48710 RepID=A0ABP1PX26_9HEXA